VIVIRQTPVNRKNRDPQKGELVLFEKDELELADQLDARLRSARQVKLVITDKSRGTILAEFPKRSWEMLADGADIRNRLIEFSDRLTLDARSRIFSTFFAEVLILAPVVLLFMAVAEWGTVATSKGKEVLVHRWATDIYGAIAFGITPICLLTALFVLIVIASSGPWVCGRIRSPADPLGTAYTECAPHYLHLLASQPLLVPQLLP
jgi:hypothetical protein